MSSCKKSSSLNKKSCHRKKPKESFNHTWSASTCKAQLLLQEQSPFNLATASNYIVSTLPIETRIRFYQKKYQLIMESDTQLASWIKAAKEQAAPPPPKLSIVPIPAATRSRLPDFLFASLSTRPKRRSQVHLDDSSLATSPPTAKSSISTFLKRASDTLTTSYGKQTSSKRPAAPSAAPQNPYNHRFSLASSLNRLSLSRNSCSSMILSEEPSSSPPHPTATTNNEIKSSTTAKSKYKRLSTPLSPQPQTLPPPLPLQQQQHLQPNKTLKPSADNTNVKRRPQSSILPQSSSSIFLERLRSRSPIADKTSKSCQQQPNILSQSNTTHYNSNSSIGTMDEDTPPSSPSSIDSISTPPHTPNNNGHHLLYYQQQQRNKRRSSQELLFTHAAATPAKHKPSLTMMSNISENGTPEQPENMSSLAAVGIHINHNECNPASTATDAPPLNGGNYSAITAKSLEKQQAKKKRASLSITPSLSTIRLLSQKSQFLRRQSMLA
ncbi:hypothetical protein V8B55DRAFT_1565022 [Mucor lusitanicus]|uniref:Uncharacterized protein n=2 Tax=Mucor circinelloides f. lusitanicus TaxID=29924 RepID=A0A168L877_MUCCL|nr:hypothetical protein FB192DRAFT_1476234 [Mucor lusitanicus]OAD03220.1 hypothetical protein MUCCIDRAFT_162808 [Mucor lusitanicus CBS 277.49]